MPKVTTQKVKVGEDNDYLLVSYDVNVNVEGEFTTTLKQEDVKIIESYGVNLKTNGRSNGRKGYFKASTLWDLKTEIKTTLEQCYHRKLKEQKTVIRYRIDSACSFGFSLNGSIIPNLGWGYDGQPDLKTGWQDGVTRSNAAWPEPAGVQFYVEISDKKTWTYPKGNEKTTYDSIKESDYKQNCYYLHWLNNIRSIRQPKGGSLREIDYTEERARFFVDFYKAICKLAMTVKQFEEPEAIIQLAESGRYLSTAMSEEEPEIIEL